MADVTIKVSVAIVGSRTFDDYVRFSKEMSELFPRPTEQISRVVSGGAQGADKLAERWADEQGVPTKILLPRWKRRDGSNNRQAGLERNTDIIEAADVVVAFWTGKSPGTRDSIRKAEASKKKVHTVRV